MFNKQIVFLVFQLLGIVSTILIRNPELTLKELDLDSLVSEANKMFCKASIYDTENDFE